MLPVNGEGKGLGGSDGGAGVCPQEGVVDPETDCSLLGGREDSSTAFRRLEAESDGLPDGILSEM